jgi:histidyl-tRNA synthetase
MSQHRRISAPKGTRDVLPAEHLVRSRILETAKRVFDEAAFGQITTPTFEDTELFSRGVGTSTDIVRKEMYTFDDAGGRSLTLRPEGTAAVARAYVQHGMSKLPQPVKLWYVAPMFRHEAPQSGRYREHWQVGAEAIGSQDPLLDAESIAVLAELYRRLEVPDVRLRIGSMGDEESRGPYRALLLEYLEARRTDLPEDAIARMSQNPLRLFDHKDRDVIAVMAEAPLLADHLGPAASEHQGRVFEALLALGVDYEVDPRLVRGLDYYTHTVFEFTCDRLGAQSGIGGGGRYDRLVADLGGPDSPGVGFGSGIERITLALGDFDPSPAVDCYVAIPDDGLRAELLAFVTDLRRSGLRVETDLRGRSMKAMMRHAASLGARWVVIVGPQEHEEGVASVRDMESGEQRAVPLARVAEVLG